MYKGEQPTNGSRMPQTEDVVHRVSLGSGHKTRGGAVTECSPETPTLRRPLWEVVRMVVVINTRQERSDFLLI